MYRSASDSLSKVVRSGRFIPLLLSFAISLCATSGTGCRSAQPIEVSPPVTNLEPPVSAEAQKQAEQAVSQFISAVQQKDYNQVKSLMSPTQRAKAPSTLAKWLEEGALTSLDGAKDLQYPSMEHTSRGKKLVVHTRFKGSDGNPYRTNIIFTPVENVWRIDKVLPPTMPSGPSTPAGSGPLSKAPGS